eukprot:3936517-Rhodomonas_salina.2
MLRKTVEDSCVGFVHTNTDRAVRVVPEDEAPLPITRRKVRVCTKYDASASRIPVILFGFGRGGDRSARSHVRRGYLIPRVRRTRGGSTMSCGDVGAVGAVILGPGVADLPRRTSWGGASPDLPRRTSCGPSCVDAPRRRPLMRAPEVRPPCASPDLPRRCLSLRAPDARSSPDLPRRRSCAEATVREVPEVPSTTSCVDAPRRRPGAVPLRAPEVRPPCAEAPAGAVSLRAPEVHAPCSEAPARSVSLRAPKAR